MMDKGQSSINDNGKAEQAHANTKKLGHYLTSYSKINSKWTEDYNVKPETIKVLVENIGSSFLVMSLSNISPGMSLQAKESKTKINNWDYSKLKRFCTTKKTINKIKKLLNGRRYLQAIVSKKY